MAAAIHSVISEAVLNAISVTEEMSDFMAYGVSLPNVRIALVDSNAVRAQAFGGLSDKELRDQDEGLKRIREVSADMLAFLKENPF